MGPTSKGEGGSRESGEKSSETGGRRRVGERRGWKGREGKGGKKWYRPLWILDTPQVICDMCHIPVNVWVFI